MKTMFVTDEKGKKVSIILSIKEYERMIEELEELEDIRMYDKVKDLNEVNEPIADYLKKRAKRKNNVKI